MGGSTSTFAHPTAGAAVGAFDFDLFTIGAGSGGVRASRMSARYGARVAIAEETRPRRHLREPRLLPKKLLVYASAFRRDVEDADGFGWTGRRRSTTGAR